MRFHLHVNYVSDFRNKLTRACELARANLRLSQKSMEERYDANTTERSFKPGQKVSGNKSKTSASV